MKLVHWPLTRGLLHLVQRAGDWLGPQPTQAPPPVPNVTAHPSTASVPITVLLYNDPLLCGFNVVKGLTEQKLNVKLSYHFCMFVVVLRLQVWTTMRPLTACRRDATVFDVVLWLIAAAVCS